MQGQYSLRSPAVKRLMKEAQELREPTEQYHAQPLEDNLFEWHFTIRGPADSDFNGGIYHGRIILPPEYPMKPPSIIVLTPNGRFETHTKICLSISGHHPESWQPSWSIRTALLAIIGFMPTHGAGAMGSLDYTPEERKRLAKRSLEYKCPVCGSVRDMLHPVTDASKADSEEAKELASQIKFEGEKNKSTDEKLHKNKENTTPPPVGNTPLSSNPAMMVPPLTQMMINNPLYNPMMSSLQAEAGGTRTSSPNGVPQIRPFMPFAQFAAMQSMMQQQMHGTASQSGVPGWGMPGGVAGMLPRFPSPQIPTTTKPQATTTSEITSNVSVSSSTVGSSGLDSSFSRAPTTPSSSASLDSSPSKTVPTGSRHLSGTTSDDGIRHRVAASGHEATSSSVSTDNLAARPADIPQHVQPQLRSGFVQLLMLILALAILFLLLRRLLQMGVFKFDQNTDL